MSNKAVEELENILCHNAKDYLIHEWIDKCFLDKSPKFLSYFFRKCSEQFLAYQDGKCSSIIHGLVKSHMSSSNKMKSLKMLLIRGVNCNKLDGNKKSIFDLLVEDNDWECIKILLDYGQNLMVLENCLCMVFKLRNEHEEIFKALFAYAIKHKVAPNLTGISDGDTFLHEIMVHEKEIAHFKKWMGFFLSFPEININALNNDGLTIFDLLLLNYKKKKCECAIKLLIKYRINKFSKIDCIQPQLFSFKSQIKKEICNYISKQDFFSKSVLKNENSELCTSNTELSIISSGKGFSHNYLKLKQTPLWSSAKSSQTLKKSLNDSVNLVNIPNYEETEITFEVEIFDKIPQKSKPKQTHLPELAKTKKYLSSKEAIVLIKEDNNKSLPCHLKMITESKKDGYMEEETKRDSVLISNSTQQLSQESSTIESTESLEKLENESSHHIELLNYRKLHKRSYVTSNDVLYNGHPHVDKAVNPFKGKKSNKKFFKKNTILLQLIFCNHPNKQHFLGIRYHKNTPLQGMEEKWLNKSIWYKTHLLLALYSQKKNELHTGIFIDRANGTFKSFLNLAKNNEATKLHKQDIIHHSVKGADEALSIASNSKFFHKTQEVVAKFGQLYLHLVRITKIIGAKQQGFQVCERRFQAQILFQLEKITMCADLCSIITPLKVLNINRTVLAQLQKALISYKLMLWTSFPVKDEIAIKYHLIDFKKLQAILKNYCFYYACALSKQKAEVTVNHVYHSFNIEVIIKYMCVVTSTTANYDLKNIKLRNDNIIPQLSIKNAYFSSDVTPCSHVCVIDETILQDRVLSQRRASAVTKSFGNENSSDDEGNGSSYGGNEDDTFCCCAHHTSIPPILNLKRSSYTLLNINKNLPSTTSYQRPETSFDLRTGTNIYWQQQTPSIQSLDCFNPVSIISRASLFLTAGDYGATIKILEVLDKHLLLLDEVDMAKEFGQGLANFKNLHYRAAKPCFTALLEKAINHHSTGDQALASIYLGEIEMSWAKYKDAVKHFTIAVTNYSTDNVAKKFYQTILTKSAVLVKKGYCHRSLSQIKEAINLFKTAKKVAESTQEQARGYKLKTAKEDELNAVSALGSIFQSINDYEQSFDYYQKSLKLAVELGDHVSIGWAHGNLGNAMLGLDQKDKALDHLITAFHMSVRYEGNPLAVGRAVSNLGNAYQAIGNLPKAMEHYEIALKHAIYGNDLQGQGRACGNIGNIYMLLKEPVKAGHYYTETLRLSTHKNTKITGHHNRGCTRFDVAECIIQGKKPNELVPATTPGSEYGRLAIKRTDEVITTDPVQETKPNRETIAQSVSESSMPGEKLPIPVYGIAYEKETYVEIVQAVGVVPFFEAAKSDLLEAIESHEQSAQNIRSSHRNLSLLSKNNSQSLYKMQETFVELGRLYQQLSRLGLMDMAAADPQEFKEASVYGEQARARTLGELVLQKKKTTYSYLLSISTPLAISNIYKTVMRTTEIIGAKQQGFQVCRKKFHARILIQLKKITMCTDLCSITTPLKVLNINRMVLAQPQKALISYKLLLWTSFPVKEKIAIKYHLIEFKKLQAILKNYCFYYTCVLSKPKAEVTVNHVYHSFNIEVVIKYMCVSTNTTANYGFKGKIELRNDNIIPQLSIKNAYFSSDITSCSHACVIDETILQVSQRRASTVTRGIGNESSSDDKGNSDSNGGNGNSMLYCCAHYTTSIPPILTDTLLNINKKLPSTTSYQRLETRFGLRISTNVDWQQQTPSIQSLDCSNPISIIKKAVLFVTAGDYGATIKVLEILDKHLLIPDGIDIAKEFLQGLANYKNLHYRAAKRCFTALFEKATNHCSTSDQTLASIYLGEIEKPRAKYKDAVKHFTIAVTNYSANNVAEKFQQTILSKSAVLVKKGHCHRSLSQIQEAIYAFIMAKEIAESRQEQARGYQLKKAKEDELSAVCPLGNILQSIGDYEQSLDYYQKSLKLAVELGDHVSIGWAHGNLGNAMLGLDQKDKALDHLITAFHMSVRYEGNPLAVGRAVSNLGNAYQAIGNLPMAKEHYEIALGHAIYGNDLQGQGHACSNIGNIYMLLKEPVKAVHYYTETLRLSMHKNTKITGHHNRGCVRFDVAECIMQGKKPNELVPATTPGSEYGRLVIKRTDEAITIDPVQETNANREPLAQSFYEQKESSMSQEGLPMAVYEKANEGKSNEETVQAVEALPFLGAAKSDLLVAIESHEQSVQNVKGSHEALSLSLSLFESNSRSFYKMQETLVEFERLYQKLSRLGLMDMATTDPQEFKDALVYGEQARARTLGELALQKKKATYSDLFSISTPLTIPNIYKTVTLPLSGSAKAATTLIIVNCKLLSVSIIDIKYKVNVKTTPKIEKQTYKKIILPQIKLHIRYYLDEEEVKTEEPEPTQKEIFPQLNKIFENFLKENCEKCSKITTVKFKKKSKLDFNSLCDVRKKNDATISIQGFIAYTLGITFNSKFNNFKESYITTEELQKLYWNKSILKNTKIEKKSLQTFLNYFTEKCQLQQTKCDYNLFRKFIGSNSIEQSEDISQIPIVSIQFVSIETRNANKSNLATTNECQSSQSTNSRDHSTDSNDAEHLQEGNNEVEISTPCQVIDNYFQQDKEIFYFTVQKDHLHAFEDLNSETSVDICVDNLPESLTFSDTPFISNIVLESLSTTAQESFQHFVQPPESLSVNVIGQKIYVPSHSVPTISCSDISISETVLQDSVLFGKEENAKRGEGDGSDSSSDEDNNGRGIHSSFASHYGSRSSALQTSARTSHIAAKYPDGRLREAVAPPQAFMGVGMSMGIHTKPSSVHSSSGDYLISSNLAERGPILLDIPNGRNELVIAAQSNLSIPKLYPIVGFRQEPPGIALPQPIPLDLPKIDFSKKVSSRRQVVRQQPVQTGYDVGTVPEALPTSNATRPQLMASGHQQLTLDQSIDLSDPVNIIDRAALFLSAGDYGATIKVLEILDKHLLLPDEVDMAKEFGQGLANFKNLHYRAAKPCFTALFVKATNHHSTGDQALASIYLGEIEMSWAKYKDAVKHFTIAVTNYSADNVAEKFQQTILSKSAVLVKKGHCHRSLSQIKEAINAFKLAKEVAESRQEQAVGSKLKTAKEDELSAICALGNILQSIGDYEQSFDNYQKSLRLAVELGDHVSIGWAHGNLGNAMLGLDQKDKALDHLITAFHMSARYEGNPLAVGRAVSNLGNAYQAIGNLPKAKEHYEIALGHAIYGNDLQGQGRACGNIGNIYMLLKEPVKAVHYYSETLRLSTDKNTKITGHHNRGCARFDVAECIIQGKKPKELVPATTPGSEYGRLAIKLTDEVITTDPVLETKPNRETSAQSISEQRESSMPVEVLPIIIKGKAYEGIGNVEIIRTAEALPFLETARRDLFEAIQSHEQGVQNVKGSHEALSLSLSLFESNSRSFYKMQETLVELGRLYQQLSRLGLTDMAATDPQEFKDALVYGEQARARTLGELVLQKKKATYSDLFSISTPLTIQDIYKTVNLQKVPVVFLSYCVSKFLMWIMVKKKDEVVLRCQSVELKEEDLENGSFELYIRYNLLQFLSKDEIYIFRRCAYEQESPFSLLHDVIAIKIIEGLKSVGFSEVTEFIVIPDSVTHLLPFSPLMNKRNWQFFGDKYRIRIVPSFLSLLVMSMTSNPVVEIPGDKNDFLIAGNPTIPPFMYDSIQWNLGRLPYAEKEAISVANIIGTIPVLREQATKQSVLYRLRSAKVIHLATHGSASGGFLAFTSSFPISKSGLAEKEHILIFPKEIETLNISPALVVLSSCDSARGQVKAEGVIGMARAFLSAGAHSVLVSLWRVPDESANVFMNFFYQFLVNGLPSLQALQRSMQCLRCFLKYSHYVHWSGFQIIGKEVSFHKNSSAQFPIQKLLGEVSIFPRPQVKIIEENLLGVKNKIFTDIQLLVGTPGNEPEECARDFIKNCYYYYPCGVYWYDATNELLLETSTKVAREMPLKGAVYKEQKEPDPLPTISNPSLLTTKGNKPTSRKDKRLIVLHNFTSLENYHFIMREMKDASTDIIVVSNELFCKEETAQEFDKYFNRGCNIIELGNLQPISILQRIVYGLLEKNSFVARDADHIVFTLLSEYSRGAATVVHMLTSLMQKSDENSRTGFELAKQQLKLHIAHLKLGLDKHGILNILSEAEFFANSTGKVHHRGKNVAIEKEFGIIDSGHLLQQPDDDVNKQDNVGKIKQNDNGSESPITIIPECYNMQESCFVPSGDDKPSNRKALIKPISIKEKGFKKSSSSQSEDEHTMTSSIIAKSDDDKHNTSSDAIHPPGTIELEKEGFVSTKKHPLYLYINDILNTTSNISLPAHHLLKSLTITGPIPLPWFYVEELDNVVMNAVFNKEKKRIQAESPMNQLIKEGVIRRSCYPILYHKDLNTDYIDLSIQQMTVPKLICDAVKDEMDDTDKVLAVLSAQQALENLTNEIKPSLIHLQYIYILSNQLHDVCTKQLHSLGDELLIAIQKLNLRVAIMASQLKSRFI